MCYTYIKIREGKPTEPERIKIMTISEIIKAEISFDLRLYKEYRAKTLISSDKRDMTYYRNAAKRSWHRIEAKRDLASSLGYTVLFGGEDAETMEVISVYPMELDV